MFHILSGSSSTPAASVSESHHGIGDGGKGPEHAHTSNSSYASSNKKRSRRRRKGKSRTKVEPIGYKKASSPANANKTHANNANKKHHDAPMTKRDIYFALDCEMVGVGPDGLSSAVGRVTIVNWENQIVLDTYVRVPTPVTDYRTHVSGITPEHLQPRPNHPLMTFAEVREKVQSILRGKILIGHALENDLKALGLYHPWTDIRDTATYSLFMREFRDPVTQCVSLAPKKLRDLTWEKLGRQIQMPGAPHSPFEDAVAALDLYKEARGQWEDHLVRLAQQKDKEQQQQLMERRRQQEQEHQQRQQEQQQQHQQMQMRRFQWLAGNPPPPQQMYLPQQQAQHPGMMHPPPVSPSYRYPPGMMMMPPPNPPASAYLQQQPPSTPSPQQQPIRLSGSSWFGFSRRPRQQQHATQSRIPMAASIESVATMSTVQSSFSQDFSSPRAAWHEDNAEDKTLRMATEVSQEKILEETLPPADDATRDAESTTESITEESTENEVTTDYKPPRYFTNPDPEPMSSSSWFKLWGSSRKDKDSSTRGYDSDPELEPAARRGSESDAAPSYSLFSGRLFPRRNSESCMANMCEKEVDEHARSLH